jgi:gliding motility-associated lipoprotein GldJ
LNEKILIDKGIQEFNLEQTASENFNTKAYYAGAYEGIPTKRQLKNLDPTAEETTRGVQLKDGILLPNFRLPTEAEWEYAAYGLAGNTYDERIIERRVYPWNGSNVRSSDPEHLGQMQANFARGRGDFMGVAGNLNDGAMYPTQVYAYAPNDYGLYNMASNVSEWTMDVYRPLTLEDASGMNPFRGNVYQTIVRDEEGNVAEKDSLGRIQYRNVTSEEVANRRNYQKADNRNYLDGDYASTMTGDWKSMAESEDEKSTTADVYDPTASAISDNSRVIKGGNYRDRAYWLSPSTRRFLDQDRNESWVGFRCAMSRIGNTTQSK